MFCDLIGVPVASTLMCLGAYPTPLLMRITSKCFGCMELFMLIMHRCVLLLVFELRFDDCH